MTLSYLAYGRDYLEWAVSGHPAWIYGFWDFLINYVLPVMLIVFCWRRFAGTPGKLLMRCQVVDATTGRRVGLWQALVRCMAYLISMLPLGLGFLWIAWDRRKQGFHDKLAGTLVIMESADWPEVNEIARRLE